MAPDVDSPRSGWRLALFFGLGLFLCAPFLAWILRIPELAGVQEMRPLAAWPDWRATKFEQWPGAFDKWLDDHYPSRTRVVQWYGILRHRWLGQPSSRVVVGRNDWLFYTGEKTVEDLLGRDRMNAEELASWQLAAEGRRAWWREQGVEYLLVVAPNKSTIYPEHLPAFLRAQARPGKLDQLVSHLREQKSPVRVLDLRAALLAAKEHAMVYWPTDSHWNAEGLEAASDAILARLREMGVPLRAPEGPAWRKIERVAREGDCIGLLTLNGRWPLAPVSQLRVIFPPDLHAVPTELSASPIWQSVGPWAQPVAFERSSGVGRVVMLCDSFFRMGGQPGEVSSQSPLILGFRRFVSLWSWNSTANLASYELCAEVLAKEHPTVVIDQWTERYLRTQPPDHPEFRRARSAAHGQ